MRRNARNETVMPNTRLRWVLVMALAHVAATGAVAQAPAAGTWTGKAVVPKVRSFMIKESAQASARPGPPAIYHVSRESGQLLFITTNGLSGWVSADQFVPLEEARVFFTGQIQANPRDSFAHAMRAIAALAEKPDFKSAMADLDEAVRLGPGDAFARGSRGVAWLAQQDLARAHADFDEAIRLEPRNPAYLIDRAAAWRSQHIYDKAKSDCDAALRARPALGHGAHPAGGDSHRTKGV